MRESVVEKYLREQVEAAGGLWEKHVSPGLRGVPDDLVSWPKPGFAGVMDLVETKQPGKMAKPHQARDHKRRLRKCGIRVYLIDTMGKVDDYVWYRRRGATPSHLWSIQE